ncbi:flavin reductase [Lichenicola sp.]|uniref:flavin reductase n=1 Tax=Lichenicola sp. TaxID=2804529 RepID=UPI003AFF6C79
MDEAVIDSAIFREGMSRLAAAVSLVTTDGPRGRHGFTASAVCSVTDTPPVLLVCMNRDSVPVDAFRENSGLCVNVLSGAHQGLSDLFADPSIAMANRFAASPWLTTVSGAPMLPTAVVSFDCSIAQVVEIETHSVLFCRVRDIGFADPVQDALLWCSRGYHTIPLASRLVPQGSKAG